MSNSNSKPVSASYAGSLAEVLKESSYVSWSLSVGLLLILGIRYLQSSPSKTNGKFTSIYQAALNIPLIGHSWGFLLDPNKFLRSNRDKAIHGIFGLNMFGTTTNIIHSPSLMKAFFAQPNSVVENKTMGASIATKIFGFPAESTELLIEHFDELMNTVVHNLMKGPGLERIWTRLRINTETQVPEMLSFATTSEGQHRWERLAATTFPTTGGGGGSSVEASLFPLVRNCVGHMSSRAMMGSDLCTKHPDILDDIWNIDANIMGFIYGFPTSSSFFFPGMSAAYTSRTRILKFMNDWHQGMEDEGLDGRFADVSDMMKARQRVYSARGFSIPARAAIDVSLLWALNANSNAIVYWMLFNIHATPGMLARVRKELAPYVVRRGRRGRRRNEDGLPSSSSSSRALSIDTPGLLTKCPVFKSCYWESLRIDSGPWSFKRLQKDCVVSEVASDFRGAAGKGSATTAAATTAAPSAFSLRKGDAVLIPADLHHTDPRYFAKPDEFIPDRFLVSHEDDGDDGDNGSTTTMTTTKITSEIGTIRPYGGGATMCKGRVLAEREVLSFVAGVLMSWEMEPVDVAQGWKFEGRVKTSGVCGPKGDLRVRLSKRE